MTASRPLDESLEELVLGAPRRFTRLQVAEAAGLAPEEAEVLFDADEIADGARIARPVAVRGYRNLHPWRLEST